MGDTPAGKLYEFTSKKTGEKLQFRSTVKPDKSFIKQKFDELRANKEALAQSKIQAAQEADATQKKAFWDVSNIPSDIASAGKGLTGVLGGPLYQGIEAMRSIPEIPSRIQEALQQPEPSIEEKVRKGVQELPIVGDIGQTASALGYGITPKLEPIAEYLETTPEKAALGGGVLAGMTALGGALRGARTAKAPKAEIGLEPFEEAVSEVPQTRAPQQVIADAQVHSANLGIIKEQLKGVDKSLHNQVLSEIAGREVKGLKNLNPDEAALIADNFRQQVPQEVAPVEAPKVVSMDEAEYDPNYPRTYTPERLRQMDIQEDEFLRAQPEPLITPPPETGIVPVGEQRLALPDVGELPRVHEQMTLENNLRRLYERQQLGDVEEPATRPITDRERFIDYISRNPKTIEAETFPVEEPQGRTPAEVQGKLPEVESPKLPQIPAREGLPLSNKEIIESQGLKFEGEMEGLTYFTDPLTKSTLTMEPETITPESLVQHVKESRAKFGIKEGLQEPKEVTESPPAFIEKHPDDVRLETQVKPKLINAIVKLGKKDSLSINKQDLLESGLSNNDLNLAHSRGLISLSEEAPPYVANFSNKLMQELKDVRPQNLTPEQKAFIEKGGKITKLPPVEPTEPIEFGRTLEEGKAKAEKKGRKSLLRKFHEEESGFLDVGRIIRAFKNTDEQGRLKPAEERSIRQFLDDYLMTSVETQVERIGGVGKQGTQIRGMFEKVRSRTGYLAGNAIAEALGIVKRNNLSKADIDNLALVVEGKAKPINDSVALAATQWNKLMNAVGKKMEQSGVHLKTIGGKSIPFKRREGGYWHHVYDKKFWEKLDRDPTTKQAIVNKIMKDGKVSYQEAEQILRLGRRYGEKYISAQRQRTWDVPGYETTLESQLKYFADASKRIAEAEILGPKDIADPASPISRLMSEVEKAGGDVQGLRKYLSRALGRDELPEVYKYKVANAIANVISLTHLQAFPISNLAQIAHVFYRSPVGPALKGILNAAFDYINASERALRSGATLEAHKTVKEFAGKMTSHLFQMERSERFNRVISSEVGRYTAEYWFDYIKKNPNNTKIKARLRSLIQSDVDVALKRGNLSNEELSSASLQFSDHVQGTVHPLDLPYAMSNSPLSKLYWIFKRYAFSSSKNIFESIKDNPARAIPALLITSQLAGEVIGDLKKFLSEGMEGVEKRGQWIATDNPLANRMIDNVLQAWALGIPGDIAAGLWTRGQLDVGGAAGEIGAGYVRAGQQAIKGNLKPLKREAIRALPIPLNIGKKKLEEKVVGKKKKSRSFRKFPRKKAA